MDNIRILWNNHVDLATITKSSEVSTLPAANVADTIKQRKWRTPALSGQWIAFDFGESKTIGAIYMLEHNLTVDGTYRVMASDDSDYSNLLFDETFVSYESIFGFGVDGFGAHGNGGFLDDDELDTYGRFSLQFITQTEARYWKIEFTDAGNSDNYIEVGRIFICHFFEPAFNFNPGWEIEWHDSSKLSTSLGGVAWSDNRPRHRKGRFTLGRLDDSERDTQVLMMQKIVGISKDVVLCFFPDKEKTNWYFNSMYVRLQTTAPVKSVRDDRNKVSFSFKEAA